MTAADRPLHRGLTVIFKGSNRCNARCTYCSVGQPGARMVTWDDFEVLATNLEQLVAAWPVGQVVFTFHGGECRPARCGLHRPGLQPDSPATAARGSRHAVEPAALDR